MEFVFVCDIITRKVSNTDKDAKQYTQWW